MEKVTIGPPSPLLGGSPAVRAGDFLFLSGHSSPEAGQDPLRFRAEDQTAAIFQQMQTTLTEAGSSMEQVVKLQTFHRDLDELPQHLGARTRAFDPPLPPSTAVEAPLSHPSADVTINAIALTGQAGAEAIEVDTVPRPLGPYSQAVSAPPFLFVAGVLASDFRTGVAPEARVSAGLPYFGSAIKSQTAYVLEVIGKILEGAGSSLESVVKAQVILTDMSDFWGFEEVWSGFFTEDPPARTVVQGGLVNPGCIVEIDVIALAPGSGMDRQVVTAEAVPASPLAESPAIRAGEWIFVGGQLATDYTSGLMAEARIDPSFPRYDLAAHRQGNAVVGRLASLLEAGGSSLDRLAHVWAFVGGESDRFTSVRKVLETSLGEEPPAVTLTGTGALYVPECVVAIDAVALADG